VPGTASAVVDSPSPRERTRAAARVSLENRAVTLRSTRCALPAAPRFTRSKGLGQTAPGQCSPGSSARSNQGGSWRDALGSTSAFGKPSAQGRSSRLVHRGLLPTLKNPADVSVRQGTIFLRDALWITLSMPLRNVPSKEGPERRGSNARSSLKGRRLTPDAATVSDRMQAKPGMRGR